MGSTINIEEEVPKLTSYNTQQATEQSSIFFLATEKESGEPEYTEAEQKEGYRPEWHSLDKSIKILESENPSHYIAQFINARDPKVLRDAKDCIRPK